MFLFSKSADDVIKMKLTEGKVQGLGREVTNDVGCVSTPEGDKTLITVGADKAVGNALVGRSETTLLDLRQ